MNKAAIIIRFAILVSLFRFIFLLVPCSVSWISFLLHNVDLDFFVAKHVIALRDRCHNSMCRAIIMLGKLQLRLKVC
jgi:hypothetical protein